MAAPHHSEVTSSLSVQSRTYVRNKVKQEGWDRPHGNLLDVYLQACEVNKVTANSAVAEQLMRRSRIMQALPWQRVMTLDAQQLLEAIAVHLAPLPAATSASGVLQYSCRALEHACRLINPRHPWDRLCAQAGIDPAAKVLSGDALQQLVWGAAAEVPLPELRQAAGEVLLRPVGHGSLDLEGLIGVLFAYLDVSEQGWLLASEVRLVVSRYCPTAANNVYELISQHPPLARGAQQAVTRQEFVDILVALAPQLVPSPPGSSPPASEVRDKAEVAVNAIIDDKIREPFCYDFSRCYVGPKGLVPLVEALKQDDSFGSLRLANCGLCDSAVEQLAQWLQSHPTITSLDLTNNPFADRGGVALTELLTSNPRIVELAIGGTYLLRGYSRTHHHALGPSPCEDAVPLLQALAANRAERRSSPQEIVKLLQQHGPELRSLCFQLAASLGAARTAAYAARVPLPLLQEALEEITADWGFTPKALEQVMQAERLLGTASARRGLDDSGRLAVTYEELMHFLRGEDQVTRVARAVRNHLLEVKQLFYRLADESAASRSAAAAAAQQEHAGSIGLAEGGGEVLVAEASTASDAGRSGWASGQEPAVSGPRLSLLEFRLALINEAAQPGSGWDVSVEDLDAVLAPGALLPHVGAAAGPAGGAPQGAGPHLRLSWPQLADTLLYLFNR